MARKEWELLFNLSAKQDGNFSSTFKAAQSALVETQNRIQQLNKVQSDIIAYQKQQQVGLCHCWRERPRAGLLQRRRNRADCAGDPCSVR